MKLPSGPVLVAAMAVFPAPIKVTSAPTTNAPDKSTAFPVILAVCAVRFAAIRSSATNIENRFMRFLLTAAIPPSPLVQ